MMRQKSNFENAVMSTLETIDVDVVDEYDTEQLELLEDESEEAENLARELFSEEDDDDESENVEFDLDDNMSDEMFGAEIGEGSHGVDESMNIDDVNVSTERGEFLSANTPLFYDYACFNDVSDWLVERDDSLGYDSSHDKGEFYKGQRFVSKDAVIYAVQVYSIRNRVEYKVHKSEPCMINLKCRFAGGEGLYCKWHFRAVKKKKSVMFAVSVYKGPHTCKVEIIPSDSIHLNKDFIGWEIKDFIQERPRISPLLVKKMIQRKYECEVSYLKAWRGRQKAVEMLFGDWEKSFDLLPSYMDTLCKTNPGSVVHWQKSQVDDIFYVDRLFWSFAPAIEAYKACRPVLSIDGTHLYGKYKGTLLVAVGLDANNHVLPLAFALVESENINSWQWFMSCIRLGVTDRDGLCVISDRHIGIMNAMKSPDWSPPRAHHRFCVRHFVSDFMTRVRRTELKKFLATVAYQNQAKKFEYMFRDLMELLKKDVATCRWLLETPKEKWSLAYDEYGMRWGSMTTNASEVFNGVIKSARDLPITALVHYTFKQTNEYFERRRSQYIEHENRFSQKIEEKMDAMLSKALFHEVTLYNTSTGEASVITGASNHVHQVHLGNKTCSCGKWQTFHYPCTHVLAVCSKVQVSTYFGVAYEYSMDAYNRTYYHDFHPMPNKAYWELGPYPTHVPNPWFRRPPSRG